MSNSVRIPNIFMTCKRPESQFRPVLCLFFYSDVDYQGFIQIAWAALNACPWEMVSGCLQLRPLSRYGNESRKKGSLYNCFFFCLDKLITETRFGHRSIDIVYNKDDPELRTNAFDQADEVTTSETHGQAFRAFDDRLSRRHSAFEALLQWYCYNHRHQLHGESAWHHMVQFTGLERPKFSDVEKSVVSMTHHLKWTSRYSQAVALSMAYSLGCDGRPSTIKGTNS